MFMHSQQLFPSLQAALAGQYQFERILGRGGMGTVILARDVRLDRRVAIKVLPTTADEDPVLHARFLREARTAGQLSHPNIVPVFRADELGGHAFFAMPYIEGDDMGAMIQREGTLPALDVARWLREVSWALAYSHARGVVHRDIKPENIMIERGSGRALVTDFGLARNDDIAIISHTATDACMKTAEGEIVGSVHYMSPEQITAGVLDGRSDLYSLGVIGFHAITGRLPFDGSVPAVLFGHVNREAPRVQSYSTFAQPHLAAVLDRCLAKDPSDRYQTGEALADALEKAMRLTGHNAEHDVVPKLAPLRRNLRSARRMVLKWRRWVSAAASDDVRGTQERLRARYS
jgi:serine/threonine-protein kinase